MNTSKKINLLGLTQRELEKFFIDIGEPKYRAVQTLKWIHKHGCLDFDQMSDLSEALRKKLHNIASLKPPLIHHQMKSKDGTIKYLIQIESGSIVEMVRIPSDNRQTLCISSQAGCALQCSFCATGAHGRLLHKKSTVMHIQPERKYIRFVGYLKGYEPFQQLSQIQFELNILLFHLLISFDDGLMVALGKQYCEVFF